MLLGLTSLPATRRLSDQGCWGICPEGGELWVEKLGSEGAGEGFYGFALLRGQLGQFGLGAGQFGGADGFGVLLEGQDGGDGVAGLETLLVLGHLFGDDVLGGLRFPAAVGEGWPELLAGGRRCRRRS